MEHWSRKACGLHCIKIKEIGVKIGDTQIIEHINLHIHCGMLTAIIGRNGAGKSTLLKAILGELPHEGSIEFRYKENGQKGKLKMGYVPQSLNIDRETPTSVYDFIAGFLSKTPVFLKKDKKLYGKIKLQLRQFQAGDLIDKQIGALSGGELQRVLLSAATIPMPNLLVLDEPVSGMDQNGIQLFYHMIDRIKKNYDLAIILVSHDLEYVQKYADNVVLLDKTVLLSGTPSKVMQNEIFQKVFGKIEKN